MKIKIFMPFFAGALLLLTVLSGCSKEKRFERSLYKKDGQWTIANVAWERVINSSSGTPYINMGSTANAGTFTFDKDGSGSYSFTVDGATYSQTFSWTVSGTSISIVKVSQTFTLTGDLEQLAIAFSGSQGDKKNLTLTGTETKNYETAGDIEQEVLTGTFTLTKN